MLNCEETSKLVSQGLDRKLPWRKRMAVRFHLLMCFACSAYKRQLTGLESAIRKVCGGRRDSAKVADESLHLSDEARQRIVDRMKTGA